MTLMSLVLRMTNEPLAYDGRRSQEPGPHDECSYPMRCLKIARLREMYHIYRYDANCLIRLALS